MLNFDAWPRKDDNLIRVLEAPQPHGTDACPVHATGPIDGQTMCNAHVALDNAIFQLLCFYAGIQGEIHELDVAKLRDYVANHPERDLAAGLHRVVLQMVAECLGLPEPARPQAEGERATSA